MSVVPPVVVRPEYLRKRRQTKKNRENIRKFVKKIVTNMKETKVKVRNYNLDTASPYVLSSLTDAGWEALDLTPDLDQGNAPECIEGNKAYIKSLTQVITFQGAASTSYISIRYIVVDFREDPTLSTMGATPVQLLYRSVICCHSVIP